MDSIIPEEYYRTIQRIHNETNQPASIIIEEIIKFYLWAKNEATKGTAEVYQNLNYKALEGNFSLTNSTEQIMGDLLVHPSLFN